MKHDGRHGPVTPEPLKRRYEPPRVVAYDESDLLDLVGPAAACARWTGSAPPPGTGSWSYAPGEYEDF
jgi:hypothetical protein